MQDTFFADALFPPAANILKLPLRPYSLGHEAILLRERSPFLLQSEAAFAELSLVERIAALNTAVWICSNTYSQNQSEWFVGIKARILRWKRRHLAEVDYTLATADFWNYLNAGRSLPRLSKLRLESGEKPGRAPGAPLIAQLYQFILSLPEIARLKTSSQMSRAAWDYPFGAAVWRYFVHMESEGCIQIENSDEAETRAQVEEIQNRYQTAVAAWKSCTNDDERRTAIQKHPELRDYAETTEEVSAFENNGGKPCPD